MSDPALTTREAVARALAIKATADLAVEIDRAVAGATQTVQEQLHRKFVPTVATRRFDWPDRNRSRYYRLYLGRHELISVTSVTNGDGTTVSASDYKLYPDDGPPYSRVEIDVSGSTGSWEAGNTHQQAISITGLYGFRDAAAPAGALAEALDASETGVDVTDGSKMGVGSLLLVDSERLLVTDRTWLDTTQNLGANLTESDADVTVAVSDGTGFAAREEILIDSETMLITSISGNNLTVKRRVQGSKLAAHTSGADIYASRTLTVERGAAGSTAATHSTAAALTRWVPPARVEQLAIAEAIVTLEQEGSAYARTVGSGDNQREARGAGIADLRHKTFLDYGRKGRTWSV